jgi:hypothetical protein
MPLKAPLPRVRVSPELYKTLERHARESLEACRSLADDGTPLYFPDGSGNYRALWTRDFCYMVEGAGHLMPDEEILGCIDYLLAGQREDGTIPDRVYSDGHAAYCAGPEEQPLGSGPPTDNAQFLAKALCAYVKLTGHHQALNERMSSVMAAMDSVPLSRESLVFVDPNSPHSAYGFTDCIAKTGKVLFSSLLYAEACQRLGATCADFEYHDDAHYWHERSAAVNGHLEQFMSDEYGLFMAATEDCKQIDVWGNAYAAVIRVASKAQARNIAEFFIEFYSDFVRHGFVRHLLEGEYWERLLADIEPGTYQNGGYWALPAGWVAQTIALLDEDMARMMLADLAAEFDQHGVTEWISPTERRLQAYAAGAAAVLGAAQSSKRL